MQTNHIQNTTAQSLRGNDQFDVSYARLARTPVAHPNAHKALAPYLAAACGAKEPKKH